MRYWFSFLVLFYSLSAQAGGDAGLISVASTHDANTTVERLEKIITDKGMTVFSRVDHSAAAEQVDLSLQPTKVVIFGNPKVGTKLMQCDQQVGLELPLKILVHNDANNKTWLTYSAVKGLADRYELSECSQVLGNIDKALSGIVSSAANQ